MTHPHTPEAASGTDRGESQVAVCAVWCGRRVCEDRGCDGKFPDGASPQPSALDAAIEAAARAYYDGMIGKPETQWPHHDGWAGKSETFKAKVRVHMARALEAARLASDAALTAGATR